MQLAQTLKLQSSSPLLLIVSRNSRRIFCSSTESNKVGADVGISKDFRSLLLLPQARLVFSSSFSALRESTVPCSQRTAVIPFPSGEVKSGFPDEFLSRKRFILSRERASVEGDYFFFLRSLAVNSNMSGDLAFVLVFALSFGAKTAADGLQFLASFQANQLSSSFSSRFRSSTIDFGIISGSSSIIIFQKSRWREFYIHSFRYFFSSKRYIFSPKYMQATIITFGFHTLVGFCKRSILKNFLCYPGRQLRRAIT